MQIRILNAQTPVSKPIYGLLHKDVEGFDFPVVLQTVSRDKLKRLSADPAFRKKVDALVQARRQAAKAPVWFQQTHPQLPLTRIAYF